MSARSPHPRGEVTLLGALAAIGCRESPDEPAPIELCSGAVTISVAARNPHPTFDWAPQCAVSAIVVATVPAVGVPSEYWRVDADAAVIAPAITYGRVPRGARSTGFVELSSKQDYRISMFVPGRPNAIGDGTWRQP